MADGELRIEIAPDDEDIDSKPAVNVNAGGGEKEKSEAKDPAIADLKGQFEDLKRKNEEEARRREDAEQRAANAQREAERLRAESAAHQEEVAKANTDTITTAIDAAKQAIDAAKKDIKQAIEDGNTDAQVEAQDALATARATLLRLNEAKDELDTQSKLAKEQPRRAPQSDDPVEQFIAGRPERTQRWLRDHKDYITDPRKVAKLNAAHWSANGEGITPNTDEYFDHVERFLGMKQDGNVKKDDSKEPPRRKETPPAAPGSSVSGGKTAGDVVTLSAREAKAATDGTHVWNYDDTSPQKLFKKGDPIGVQEFARRKREMMKDGRYDRSYVDG